MHERIKLQRFRELDAMRGIASAQVFLGHLLGMFGGASLDKWWVRYTPVRLLLEPHLAVLFFFVLSGFVLAVSLQREHLTYAQFISRRICRIYLPLGSYPGHVRGLPRAQWDHPVINLAVLLNPCGAIIGRYFQSRGGAAIGAPWPITLR